MYYHASGFIIILNYVTRTANVVREDVITAEDGEFIATQDDDVLITE